MTRIFTYLLIFVSVSLSNSMAEIQSLFCHKPEKSFLRSVCGPAINWSCNLTWLRLQQPGNFGYSVTATRTSGPQTEFRPTQFTSLPFPDAAGGGEGTMMQDGCKTPWTKATHTYFQPVCQPVSLTHSRPRIHNLARSHQSVTDITTDMLEDALSGWHASAKLESWPCQWVGSHCLATDRKQEEHLRKIWQIHTKNPQKLTKLLWSLKKKKTFRHYDANVQLQWMMKPTSTTTTDNKL